MTRRFFVYRITNTENGKLYIGKTFDPATRLAGHKWQMKNGHQTPVHRAMRRYGVDAFLFEVLAGFPIEDDALAFERELIRTLRTRDRQRGYNVSEGGDGPSGVRPSEETRSKMRASHRARVMRDGPPVLTPDARARIGNALRGRKRGPMSEETKAKLREASTGRKFGEDFKEKIRASRRRVNANPTPAMIAYDSERRSAASRGRKHSEESRARHSEAMKKRWADG
jgi:group I intron endonuclease